jgi:hypothetical protein
MCFKGLINNPLRNSSRDNILYFQIHFHGRDWPSLHKFIAPEILPQEYGGQKPQVDYEKNRQYLYDNEEKIMGKVDSKRSRTLRSLV